MKQFPFIIAAGFIVLVGGLAMWLSSCHSGSEIPIDPTCVELVTDECVPEVIEEFCDVCPDPVICPPPVVCPPPECFVRETEKVCVRWRDHRCCEWDHVTTFVPVDCPEPEEVEVP